VIALAKKMEGERIGKEQNVVFSYRYDPNKKTGHLFDPKYGWYKFMQHSNEKVDEYEFVVACDISEFYPRLAHHRLENALQQIAGDTPYPSRIMSFLSNYSNTRSFGLPIGGPASRILSEITINQIDRLLQSSGIPFTRFADDYHLFAKSREDAYRHLIFLSEKLLYNQGLSLQKSKTRIMSSIEFKATNPIAQGEGQEDPVEAGKAVAAKYSGSHLLRFSLTFDPYSPTAEDDYEQLKTELRRFDIIGLLKAELAKSRIHTSLARKIVSAIRYLDDRVKDEAVRSIVSNSDLLYPIFSSVLMMLDQVFPDLSDSTKSYVLEDLRRLIREQSHVMRVDVHLSFAIRVLGHSNDTESQTLLEQIYEDRTSPIVRRDIILVLARWGEWYWLSDLRNRFRELSGPERRAFIVASYKLRDEGDHWRKHIVKELNPFELFILKWAGEKANINSWIIPL
jgi:hypothetical protein